MTPDWLRLDREHVWHPYTQIATAPPPIALARGEGAYLVTPDGRRILDAISSWWVTLHGHCHPRLISALGRQAQELEQVIFAGFTHEPATRLAAALVARAPKGLTRVFYTDDGSTAVECAMKMAIQFWRNRGEPQRTEFVGLEGGYHGETLGAMAAGSVAGFHTAFEKLLCRVHHAHAASCYHCPVGKERASCSIDCAESLERLLETRGRSIAAVIVEPMLQGAGGMIVHPREFLVRVREACDRHKVLLIADEVLTGFGRTGKLFACEHGPVQPDLLCLSKALTGGVLPLAATLATEEIYAAFLSDDRSRAFLHGHSFTANPIACAVAIESLQLLEEEHGLDRVQRLKALYVERLARLRSLSRVGDTRSIGMVAAIELVPDRAAQSAGGYFDQLGPTLLQKFLKRDILLRPLGNVLYVLPPLCITDGETHHVFDVIEEVVAGL